MRRSLISIVITLLIAGLVLVVSAVEALSERVGFDPVLSHMKSQGQVIG